MNNFIIDLKNKILSGYNITYLEAKKLLEIDNNNTDEILLLSDCANEIRKHFCGDIFNLCTILNAKSGNCSENCKYCAQSSFFKTASQKYPLVDEKTVIEIATKVEKEGAHRFALVTSGRGITSSSVSPISNLYRAIKKVSNIHLCASHGLLTLESALELKNSGVKTYHHNLETSRRFYSNICTTHNYDDRINTILTAQEVGMEVCSGGIWGLGETYLDRLDMAFELKNLGITSIPINILTTIPGTPLENNPPLPPLEIIKTIAVYRFILPNTFLRYAGGRLQLKEYEIQGFKGGINSALTGNFLTTIGSTIERDIENIIKEGFTLEKKS